MINPHHRPLPRQAAMLEPTLPVGVSALVTSLPLPTSGLVVASLVVAVTLVLWRRRGNPPVTWMTSPGGLGGIPGPWGIPVQGNLLQLGRKPHVTLTGFGYDNWFLEIMLL